MGVVQIYYADHAPPHFHVQYAGETAKFEIETLALIDGSLPARARGLVTEWASLHQVELHGSFSQSSCIEPPQKIPPIC